MSLLLLRVVGRKSTGEQLSIVLSDSIAPIEEERGLAPRGIEELITTLSAVMSVKEGGVG